MSEGMMKPSAVYEQEVVVEDLTLNSAMDVDMDDDSLDRLTDAATQLSVHKPTNADFFDAFEDDFDDSDLVQCRWDINCTVQEACGIQSCLAKNDFQMAKCRNSVLELQDCCKHVQYKTKHWASVTGILAMTKKKPEKQQQTRPN